MITIAILLLLIPTAFHLHNDRRGERKDEKAGDIILVSGIAVLCSVVGFFISDKPIIDGLLLAWGIHFFVFDYAINYILKKRGVIETKESAFSYLGSSYTDDVLRQFTPWQRFFMKLIVLVVAVTIYVL